MGNLDLNHVIALYRRIHPDYSASDVFFGATTDSRDWRPAVVEIERRAAQPEGAAPTYSYQLDWSSPVNPRLKAYHGLDTELFFDNIGAPQSKTGTGPEAQAMADLMSESHLAFARTGNPQTPKLPEWPPYDLKRRATMSFNLPPRVIDDPRGEERKLFSAVPYQNPGT
jgi:para-nitrobenzyl esterase